MLFMREIKRVIFFKQVYEIDAPPLSASSVSENLRRMRLPEGKILKLTIVITFESLTWKESFKTILFTASQHLNQFKNVFNAVFKRFT